MFVSNSSDRFADLYDLTLDYSRDSSLTSSNAIGMVRLLLFRVLQTLGGATSDFINSDSVIEMTGLPDYSGGE